MNQGLSTCLQSKRARSKPDHPKAATTARPSQASFTCFHAPAVASSQTPPHTPQHPNVHGQATTPALCAGTLQADQLPAAAPVPALPAQGSKQHALQFVADAGMASRKHAPLKLQSMSPTVALLRTRDTNLSAESNQASPHLLTGEECMLLPGHAGNSPMAGLVQPAGCGAALLGSPATPSWQGTPPADTPLLTPLSSHPIDALQGSATSSASTSTTGPSKHALPAHSSLLEASAEAEAPSSSGLSNSALETTSPPLCSQHLGCHASPCLAAQAEPQRQARGSWTPGQPPEGLPTPLDVDDVLLELDSDLASADGLISPASSVASWQRDPAAASSPTSSSHPSQLFPSMPDGMPVSLDRPHQHHCISGDMTSDRLYSLTANPHADSGLCPAFAPMFGSPPLPEPWHNPDQAPHQPHQQQAAASHPIPPMGSSSWQQTDSPGTQGFPGWSSTWSGTATVTTDYAVAAAQLQQAVAQAEQLYRGSSPCTASAQQGKVGDSMSVTRQAGAMHSATSRQEQAVTGGCSLQLPSALPTSLLPALSRSSCMGVQHALRWAAEPTCPVQQPLWVPQGEYFCPCLHTPALCVRRFHALQLLDCFPHTESGLGWCSQTFKCACDMLCLLCGKVCFL